MSDPTPPSPEAQPAPTPAQPAPPPAQPAPPPAPAGLSRARAGLRGLGARCLLACLAAALPALALPWWLGGLAGRLEAAQAGLADGLEASTERAAAQTAELERLRKAAETSSQELARARHELAARQSLDALAARLAALARGGRTPDEMATDPEVAAALAPAEDGLAEVALLDPENEELLRARSGAPRGLLSERLPELAEVWAKDRHSAAWAVPGWHWLRVGNTRYGLAARLPAAPASAPAPAAPPGQVAPAPPAPVPEALRDVQAELDRAVWTLGLGIPLGGLLLALAAAWWLGLMLVRPLRRLGEAAHAAWSEPEATRLPGPEEAGLLRDLAASLARLHERMLRVRTLEHEAGLLAEQSRSLVASLDHAAEGRLGVHAPQVSGLLSEVVVALNHMLDATAQRLAGLERSAGQLHGSAERLQQTAAGLGQALEPEDASPTPGMLADLVGVQVDGLCAQVARLLELTLAGDGPQLGPEERQALAGHLQAVRTGFRLVGERVAEVLAERSRAGALREAAQALATNLAIAVEAQSRGQLERLGEDARHLARAVVDMAEGFGDALGLLDRLGAQIQERFEAAAELLLSRSQELAGQTERRQAARRVAEELAPRLPDIRAAVAGLGHDLRLLVQAWEAGLERRQRAAAGIGKLAQAAAAQADAAEALLEVAGRFDRGGPVPAEVTQRLAEQQHQLRLALEELEGAAAGAGVQVLTAEARAILDSIQSMAEEARQRLARPAPPPPPPPGRAG